MGYTNGIFTDNISESTDIYISEAKLNIQNDKYTFDSSEDIVLTYNITLKDEYNYKDFKTGIRGITLYINDEQNRTTRYEDVTLSNLKPGTYTAYYTILDKQSNTVTFDVIGESEISTSEINYEYNEEENNKIPLIIKDDSGLKGTINITVKEEDNQYKPIFTYYNVADGYKISTNSIIDAIENIYGTLNSSYTLNITYSSQYTYPSSTEFTISINNKKGTNIIYNIVNNTEGNVQINITVQETKSKTTIQDANIQIT